MLASQKQCFSHFSKYHFYDKAGEGSNRWSVKNVSQCFGEFDIGGNRWDANVNRALEAVGIRAKRNIPKRSSRETQLMGCLPEPILPPPPILNGGTIFVKAPPRAVSTTGVLKTTVRIPASVAGCVLFSQLTVNCPKKSFPGGWLSVKVVSKSVKP